MTRLMFNRGNSARALWTPDGKHIVFGSNASPGATLQWIRADGAGEAQTLLEAKDQLFPMSFTPDGKRLAFTTGTIIPSRARRSFCCAPPVPPFPRMGDGSPMHPPNPDSCRCMCVPSPALKAGRRFRPVLASSRLGHATGGSCFFRVWISTSWCPNTLPTVIPSRLVRRVSGRTSSFLT
jgi:hypothetical protein